MKRKKKVSFICEIFLIIVSSYGCTPSVIPTLKSLPSLASSSSPISTNTAIPTKIIAASATSKPEYWRISDVISIDDLSELTGYADYEYMEPDYNNATGGEPAGVFWSKFTATVRVEFRAHKKGGLEKLEDYRTAAMPGSVVWLESPLWDSGCFYYLDEWTAEIVAVHADNCYFISFVPSAYPDFDDTTLGIALMEMFIKKSEQ